ncbi:ribosomal-processing cysteine protease Prp [Camelliibacillus cellulosilyticus]|uniref:Ribosomal processing cysteine protease Prp n=1 Tax=Camelliibacillus cellulosilyticus TaxID=2174486 RepID=A0ABV9GLH9_9BACL
MIHVTVDRDGKGRFESMTISGHAGSGPYGFDLVCAGVSAVSFGAIHAVSELCGFEMDVYQAEDGGFLECRFPSAMPFNHREKAEWLMEGMLASLRLIENSYSEHIHIQVSGGGSHAKA